MVVVIRQTAQQPRDLLLLGVIVCTMEECANNTSTRPVQDL